MSYFMTEQEEVNNFDSASSEEIEQIVSENERELYNQSDVEFKYIDQKTLDSAEQINMETYLSELDNEKDDNILKRNIGVYAKVNEDGYITDVCSDIFLKDTSDWVKIDEGVGDKYAHAKSQYFSDGLINENANFIHKIS